MTSQVRAGARSSLNETGDQPPWDEATDAAIVGHPLFGALKGLVTIPTDVDLAEPADPDWGRESEAEG